MKKILIFLLLFIALLPGFIGGTCYCVYNGAWIPALGIICLGYLAFDKVVNLYKELAG